MVATSAFGLGLDFKGLSFVHASSLPLSLGELKQHIGRAREHNDDPTHGAHNNLS